MADKPILFSAPMVRALRSGTKTQTRRVIKLPHANPLGVWEPTTVGGKGVFFSDGSPAPELVAIWHTRTGDCIAARFQAGDLLYVREHWRTESKAYDDLAPSEMGGEETVIYGADADWSINKTVGRFRQGMHMPRWASRITLMVTAVKIERLQDISEEDAIAEGCMPDNDCLNPNHIGPATSIYAALWDNINGAGSWEKNPYVVAGTFEVIKQNISEVKS